MVTTVDAQDEARLLAAIKEASDLVDGGAAPTAAFAKVARDMRLTPGRIRSVCYAYNTGRQSSQREDSRSALGKFASFDLADPAAVIAAVYGEQQKEAQIDNDYKQPPRWLEPKPRARVKAAAASAAATTVAPDLLMELRRQQSERDRSKQAVEEMRRGVSQLTDRLRTKVAELVAYFQRPAALRLSFADAEQATRAYLDKTAASLLDCVYSQLKTGEKRAGDAFTVLTQPIDLNEEPFLTVKAGIMLADNIATCREAQTALERIKTAASTRLRPSVPVPTQQAATLSLLTGRAAEKEAGLLGASVVGSSLGNMLGRGLGDMPKPRDAMVDAAQGELDDPKHQNELRKIQANTMLTSMLTDPDDPLAGHDPDKVLQEFNEISLLSPRLAEQPAALRSILQRRLQGGVQPFETKEIADIEKTLAQTKAMTPRSEGDEVG